jgi:hypothetical protein
MTAAANHSMSRRPDARLLVLCARPDLPVRDLAEVRDLLRQGPRWEPLIRRADEEGVLPLLYENIKAFPDDVPHEVLERLKVHYLRNLARNARIGRQVEPLFREVRSSGLKVVLTKGLRLALTAYPDMALRPFWDVDLFASSSDWPALEKILSSQGFEETPSPESGRGGAASRPAWIYSPYFRRGDLVLEFHFNALGLHFPVRPAPEIGMLPATLTVGGTEVLVFSPEHELCYLCLHAQQHSYRKLIWLTDLGQLAARKEIFWDKVAEICKAFKIQAPVYYGLALVNRLWPETIEREVLSRFDPGFVARAVLGFFWPEAAVSDRKLLSWPYYMPSLFSLWERRSVVLAVRSLGPILFPPRPWLARACGVPENSLRLYYQYARRLSRPVGLAVRRLVGIP